MLQQMDISGSSSSVFFLHGTVSSYFNFNFALLIIEFAFLSQTPIKVYCKTAEHWVKMQMWCFHQAGVVASPRMKNTRT